MCMRVRRFASLLLLCLAVLTLPQPSLSQVEPTAAVHRLLEDQVSAWNAGDIGSFMLGYKDSPETTFIGRDVEHGYRAILALYKKRFPNRAAMGTLAFTDLDIHPLTTPDAKAAHYAVATGRFHLQRSRENGGEASGVFSLVLADTASGWKIILDHTS